MKTSIYNIFFRGLTLVSKFLFIIFLGKYSIDETNLGIFGILSTSLAFLIYVIGFDFYVFNTREIISKKNSLVENIRNQLYFHFIAYLIFVPTSIFVVFKLGFLSAEYLWIFIFLLISEHLGQELYRLFTTLEKSVLANLMLFLRSGLWVWIVVLEFLFLKKEIDLYRYLVIWSFFSYFSLLIFLIIAVRFTGIRNFNYVKPNWKWIKLGLKTSSVFFIGSLSFQVIQFSDRFMIDYFYGKKLVGVYTAYAQFTNAIDVFSFTAITMIAYPKLLSSFSDLKKYKKIQIKFLKELLIVSIFLILLTLVVSPYIFKFLDKESFFLELPTFHLLLIGVFFLIMSNIFHYDLYVKKRDKIILRVAFTGMFTNVFLNVLLIPVYDILGASLATMISFVLIFVLKFYYSETAKKDDNI
ncbi:hypothetical protein BFP77_08670 [Maribacter sp. 4U21]|uniref:oligosaccharide flippase family protein n=1 Tax=Maribacter sp. 4U21 TaxID=1889779 RepID=UPI000C1488B1|nr:polysaccharide biosynthesis C-terminal domain-containing protein [Maribacter sp. 4U21]PIB28699.1 hypothetical protein BFP77_08670 [Maribacter sp. 4U21]